MKIICRTVRDAIVETTMFIVLSFAVVIMGKPNDCSSPKHGNVTLIVDAATAVKNVGSANSKCR